MSSIFNSVKYNDNNYASASLKLIRYYKTLLPQLVNSKSELEFDVFHIMPNEGFSKNQLVSRWRVNEVSAVRIFNEKSSSSLVSKHIRPFVGFGAYHDGK